jgi:hypothetical protein
MYTESTTGSQTSKVTASDASDERQLFPFALKFLAHCVLQIETPKSEFNVRNTQHEQMKRIHRFLHFYSQTATAAMM